MGDPDLKTGKSIENPSAGKEWEDWEIIFHHFVTDGNSIVKRNKHAAELILNTAHRRCIDNLTRVNEFIKAGIGSENCDDLVELEITIAEVGFAWGFVLGQIFDFSDSQGKKSIQSLKREIFRSGVLPYIALERNGFVRLKKVSKPRERISKEQNISSLPLAQSKP